MSFSMDAAIDAAIGQFNAGQLAQADETCRQILSVDPNQPGGLHISGLIALRARRYDDAIRRFEHTIRIIPDFPGVYNDLGNALHAVGQSQRAIACYEKAISLDPDFAAAFSNLGGVLAAFRKNDEAIRCYQRAIELKPDFADAYSNLGIVYNDIGRLGEAIETYQKALAIRPDFPSAYNNLANTLQNQGRLAEARAAMEQAIALAGDDPTAHSNLCYNLQFQPGLDPGEIFQVHRQWARRHAEPLRASIRPHDIDRSPDRQLRIGYVSGDFRTHSVAWFILPILENHDRERFHITCFSNDSRSDAITARFQNGCDQWRTLVGMSDEHAAEMIRRDKIDILIDLSGHTADNRLLLFARKPAPVQLAYLGYCDTTGLETMDYWITDAWNDPPGQTEPFCTEKLIRLPETFACYQPPDQSVPVNPQTPAERNGYVTFGSFNKISKINDEVVKTWSRILEAVPNSRMLIQSEGVGDASTRALFIDRFENCGIDTGRLELLGPEPMARHFQTITDKADICLDTFPFTGHTVSLHALWMGVPLVTLAGKRHVARRGVCLLSNLDLSNLIADSESDYIDIAVELASRREQVAQLRRELRERLIHSPLMNARRFTQHFEIALLTLYHNQKQ